MKKIISKMTMLVVLVAVTVLSLSPACLAASDSELEDYIGAVIAKDGEDSCVGISNGFAVKIGGNGFVITTPDIAQSGAESYIYGNDSCQTELSPVFLSENEFSLFEPKKSSAASFEVIDEIPVSKGDQVAIVYYDFSKLDNAETFADMIETEACTVENTDSSGNVRLSKTAPENASGGYVLSENGFVGMLSSDCKTVVSSKTIYSRVSSNNGTKTGSDSGSGSNSSKTSGGDHVDTILIVVFVLIIIAVPLLIYFLTRNTGAGGYMQGQPGVNPNPYAAGYPPVGRICITGSGGKYDGYKMQIEGETLIGRDGAHCKISYPTDEEGISGLHCRLRFVNGLLELTDLQSSYGTFVSSQGQEVIRLIPNNAVYLSVGDSFYLADPRNTFIVTQ